MSTESDNEEPAADETTNEESSETGPDDSENLDESGESESSETEGEESSAVDESSEESESTDGEDEDGVELLDVTDAARRLRQQMPLFDIYCGNLANIVSESLADYLQVPLELSAEKPRVSIFDPISQPEGQPNFDRIFRYQALGSLVALSVPPGLTFRLVDIMFGGTGTQDNEEVDRELSPTENNMLDVVTGSIVSALNHLLESTTTIDESLELEPWSYQQAAKAGNIESMIAIPLRMDLEESVGTAELWFSLSVLELLLGVKLTPDQDGKSVDPAWSRAFKDQVFNCELDLKCTLSEVSMPLSRVRKMSVGDFIPVKDITEAVFTIQSLPLFKAKVGESNDQASASFLRWI
ncbi:MAG: FliM/FliN family flagellar motor switch protein [Granulosicoccus sp.]|nr:FliM/FliN family flagellar motor switch protein [Granulosicoccus sp.]